MNPAIIVIAAAAVLLIVLSIIAIGRLRRTDEGDRFRRVSDLTSAWSRQQHAEVSTKTAGSTKTDDSAKTERPNTVDLGTAERSATDSVDSR